MQEIQKAQLVATLEELKSKGFDYLKKITAVDLLDHLEVIYILYNTSSKSDEIVKVNLQGDNSIPTIMHIYKAADWYERELLEMFGIRIEGREAKKLLLEEWDGMEFPLRKSFEWGKDYKRRD
ncbi:MAG: NADH-quinone oxidoreductase subunit C [Candidatus Micrarchaeia archaeon]